MNNNVQDEIKKCKTVNELMNLWRMHDTSHNLKNFIYDGIIDETTYEASPLKICFLLEECYLVPDEYNRNPTKKDFYKYISVIDNDDYTFDLTKALKNCAPWYMWNIVKEISKMILENAGIVYDDPMKHISIVNIKKSEGESSSSLSQIKYIEKAYKDFIIKELEMVNPDIIVCGRVFDIVKESSLSVFGNYKKLCDDYSKNSGLKGSYLYDANKLVIDMWHPSSPRLGYKKMNAAYKEKLPSIIPVLENILKNK